MHVRHARNHGATKLVVTHKVRSIHDRVVEPFQKYEAHAHHCEPEKSGQKHRTTQTNAVTIVIPGKTTRGLSPVEEPVHQGDQNRSRCEGLRNIARERKRTVEGAYANCAKDQA